ncbi:MAG: hypothetical protein HeimC2_03580 [Candidatus Heimdallarchaeota archaeon LC_2]|nr:MAG: hypothetical protein HeimC2_03580 [Candidatus Heimdallarchaeota archaeon LC_2]
MKRDRNEIDNTLNVWLNKLKAVSRTDNVISEDEQALIDIIQEDFILLRSQLNDAVDTDLSDEEFDSVATDFLNDLVYKLIKSAKSDMVINNDELNLINALHKIANDEE